mgnify:CR=1 FL=1
MAMRVTQRTMYSGFVRNMQYTLAQYMESNIQGASQKRVNRPSDDPAGTALILNTRQDIANTKQYQKNVDTATGWLSLADQTLLNVSTTLTKLKGLAEEAATGTMTAENRKQVCFEIRQLFGTLLNLANTEFEGNSIFAGHKINQNAYEEALAVTCQDTGVTGSFNVTGKAANSIVVQIVPGAGQAAGDTVNVQPGTPPTVDGDLNYRWSDDGGTTWNTGTITNGAEAKISMNGVEVSLAEGAYTAADEDQDVKSTGNGTTFYVRPTAVYQGDDGDMPPETDIFGGPAGMTATTSGTFNRNVQVRVDKGANLANPGETLEYSYSTDNGSTWIKASAKPDPATGSVRLLVPGGYMDLETTAPDTNVAAGTQMIIHPKRANLDYEIMEGSYLSVNNVGKDIFGGMYEGKAVYGGDDRNMFEVVGKLIGYCETNNQQGIQECLDALTTAQQNIETQNARIGGLENRLSLAKDFLSFQKIDQEDRLSYTEDIDLTELLNNLARQEMAYNTVLKSSSMIMQLNLTKFI